MTDLRDKIAVEPLDNDRVARVERNLMAAYAQLEPNVEAPRRSWLRPKLILPSLALASAAVAAVAFVWLSASRDSYATHVTQPARLATADAPSRLELNGSTIALGAHTTIDLMTDGDGTTVVLQDGRIDCEVEPRPQRPPFIVHAADVQVRVVGTVFRVVRDGNEVEVSVSRGKVLVEREVTKGRGTYVAAKHRWDSSSNKTLTIAAYHKSKATTPDTADANDKPVLGKRTSSLPKTARKRGLTRKRKATTKRPRKGDTKQPVRPRLVLTASGLPAPLPGTPAELRSLSLGDGAKAEHAAYSLAYVHWKRTRSRNRTLKATSYYMRRFNNGTHYKHALWLKINALCMNGVTRACRTAAHSYLRRFDGDSRSDQARLIVADQ